MPSGMSNSDSHVLLDLTSMPTSLVCSHPSLSIAGKEFNANSAKSSGKKLSTACLKVPIESI